MGKRSFDVSEADFDELVADGVFDEAAAGRLRAWIERKRRETARRPPLTEILSVLGALLVCGGIILLVAYNWALLPRPLKTAIAFFLVLFPGAAGLLLSRPHDASRARAGALEAAALFQSLLFGAAVALIGQIYQLPTDQIAFVGVFALSSLILAYVYGSLGASVLFIVLAHILAALLIDELDFPGLTHAAVLLPAAPLWFLFRAEGKPLRALWLFRALFAGAFTALCFMLAYDDMRLWLPALASYVALAVAVAAAPATKTASVGAGIVLAFIGSWPDVWSYVGIDRLFRSLPGSGGAVTIMLALWILVAANRFGGPSRRLTQVVAATLPVVLTLAGVLFPEELAALAASLCVVAYAVAGFRTGWRGRSARLMNGAFLLSVAFAVARFFDFDDSLLYRGILFLLSGLSIFVFNRFLAGRAEFRPRAAGGTDEN